MAGRDVFDPQGMTVDCIDSVEWDSAKRSAEVWLKSTIALNKLE